MFSSFFCNVALLCNYLNQPLSTIKICHTKIFSSKLPMQRSHLAYKSPSRNAVVTPLRKAALYEPRIAILGIWGDTWLTTVANTASTWQYVVVTGPTRGLRDAFWKVERNFKMFKILSRKISPFYCRVSYVAVTRIPSLVLRNTWHYT